MKIGDLVSALILTVISYCIFPLCFAFLKSKPITKAKYNLISFGVNFLVFLIFATLNSILGGGVSSGAPYLLWTGIFTFWGVKLMKNNGTLKEPQNVIANGFNPDFEPADIDYVKALSIWRETSSGVRDHSREDLCNSVYRICSSHAKGLSANLDGVLPLTKEEIFKYSAVYCFGIISIAAERYQSEGSANYIYSAIELYFDKGIYKNDDAENVDIRDKYSTVRTRLDRFSEINGESMHDLAVHFVKNFTNADAGFGAEACETIFRVFDNLSNSLSPGHVHSTAEIENDGTKNISDEIPKIHSDTVQKDSADIPTTQTKAEKNNSSLVPTIMSVIFSGALVILAILYGCLYDERNSLKERNASLEDQLAYFESAVKNRDAIIESLNDEIEELEKTVEELQEKSKGQSSNRIPQLSLPELELPELELPEFTLPELNIPNF